MIPKYRDLYNSEFTQEKYQDEVKYLTNRAKTDTVFRISESPIFLTNDFKEKLLSACDSIVEQIKAIPDEELRKAIPENCQVPNDTRQPNFLCIDFGICKDQKGEIVPQLIELQGFPSLYAFQYIYEESVNKFFPFTKTLKNTLPEKEYFQLLKDVIVADENPENVILLEIFPEKQKTHVDFAFTEQFLGIKTVCLTKIKRQGKKLFYENDKKLIPIHRIYNRVIFDELDRYPDLKLEFDFKEEVDVTWVTHPNWFFKISKYILPKLHHEFVPKSYYLNEFPADEKLENFVLKPLFSFAGSGVNLNPNQKTIDSISDKENYIMQRKVFYEPLFRDIEGGLSKAEIRMLYVWKESDSFPILVGNLVRMTKVAMANVDFNKKDAIWIGSSMAFFAD